MVDINMWFSVVPMYLTEECGLPNLFLDIFIGIIRGNGLKVPLVLGHVLLNLPLLYVNLSPLNVNVLTLSSR